jgi:hypothetical protein
MACSNFTTQMYVHTSNLPNLFFLFPGAKCRPTRNCFSEF